MQITLALFSFSLLLRKKKIFILFQKITIFIFFLNYIFLFLKLNSFQRKKEDPGRFGLWYLIN